MSDSASSNIPWASVAVLAAFVSSTLLVPHSFERMRPPEQERAQPAVANELEIDARLWEDPFMAFRRHEAERVQRCNKVKPGRDLALPDCDASVLAKNRAPAVLISQMLAAAPVGEKEPLDEHLVMAVLVPGNPFVGAEERRRRARYAVLSALHAKDLVPVNGERMGVLAFRWSDDHREAAGAAARAASAASAAAGAASAASSAAVADAAVAVSPKASANEIAQTVLAPYEIFVPRGVEASRESSQTRERVARSVAVVWVNESALPVLKIDAFARMLQEIFAKTQGPTQPALAIIGPSSSDHLRMALRELDQAALGKAGPLREGYEHLARASIFSPWATAPDVALLDGLDGHDAAGHPRVWGKGDIEEFLQQRLKQIGQGSPAATSHFTRTIANDHKLLKSLIAELHIRMPPRASRRIVIFAERDSLYAQTLVTEFKSHLSRSHWPHTAACDSNDADDRLEPEEAPQVEVVYFYRGIDGVTMREGADDKPATDKADKEHGLIEWPESRDQLDYLRRHAAALKASETRERFDETLAGASNRKLQPAPIGAIGVLASDVHDKLLVLQAVRDIFPDKIFFTTDMDARFLHPDVVSFTRNLVVASSLPLSFAPQRAQDGIAPFRDVYQSSAFISTRQAVCLNALCRDREKALFGPALACPSIYEVGRSGAVEVDGYDFTSRPGASKGPRAVVAALLLAVIAGALFLWPSTPSIRSARAFLLPGADTCEIGALSTVNALIVSCHVGLAVFILGSAYEFVMQQGLGLPRIGVSALAAAVFVCVLLVSQRPECSAAQSWWSPLVVKSNRRWMLVTGVVLLVALIIAWMVWHGGSRTRCHDCEPALWIEGISAWPSHLLHVTAMFVILWALDDLWWHVRRARARDVAWLATGDVPCPCKAAAMKPWERLWAWVKSSTLLFWPASSGGSVAFEPLFCQAIARGRGPARLMRVGLWWIVTVTAMYQLFTGFSEGYVPEVPVRGFVHRQLIASTFYTLLAVFPLLVVAVADTHMLACRFIWHLSRGRTAYPAKTLERFASELGSANALQWQRHVALNPAQRSDEAANASSPHTLLDDWIDMKIVERRTAVVAPLIIGPFIVLALMVVARSRLIDSWALTTSVALAAAVYCLWLIALAALLRQAAQSAREAALGRMREDLHWLEGAGPHWKKLVAPMRELIASVENTRSGAFASFFDQPLFKALLVPLGGAGGAQLFDRLLLAH